MVVNLTTDRRPAEAQYPRLACSDNKDDLGQEWLFKLLASSVVLHNPPQLRRPPPRPPTLLANAKVSRLALGSENPLASLCRSLAFLLASVSSQISVGQTNLQNYSVMACGRVLALPAA